MKPAIPLAAAVLLATQVARAEDVWPADVVVQAPMHSLSITWSDGTDEQIPFMNIDHFEMAPPEGDTTKVIVLVDMNGRRIPIGCNEKMARATFLANTVVRKPLTTCDDPTCGVCGDEEGPRIRLETMSLDMPLAVSPMNLSAKKVGPTDIMGGPILHVDQAGIDEAVRPYNDTLLRCYQKALTHNSSLQGKVTVDMTVQADGSVSDARIASSTLSNPTVESCLVRELRKITFPKPEGATFTTISHTMNFEKLD